MEFTQLFLIGYMLSLKTDLVLYIIIIIFSIDIL